MLLARRRSVNVLTPLIHQNLVRGLGAAGLGGNRQFPGNGRLYAEMADRIRAALRQACGSSNGNRFVTSKVFHPQSISGVSAENVCERFRLARLDGHPIAVDGGTTNEAIVLAVCRDARERMRTVGKIISNNLRVLQTIGTYIDEAKSPAAEATATTATAASGAARRYRVSGEVAGGDGYLVARSTRALMPARSPV